MTNNSMFDFIKNIHRQRLIVLSLVVTVDKQLQTCLQSIGQFDDRLFIINGRDEASATFCET